MSRLYRPVIPVEVKCRVVLRQLGDFFPDDVIAAHKGGPGGLGDPLECWLVQLAALLGCERKDLRLDHDPALAARVRTGEGKRTVYTPDANDPEHLIYRTAHAHHIKTNVRGDGAQHPDRVLIKRARRHVDTSDIPEADEAWFKRAQLRSPKRTMDVTVAARRIGNRKLRSANRWPPKGSRKIQNRPRKR